MGCKMREVKGKVGDAKVSDLSSRESACAPGRLSLPLTSADDSLRPPVVVVGAGSATKDDDAPRTQSPLCIYRL